MHDLDIACYLEDFLVSDLYTEVFLFYYRFICLCSFVVTVEVHPLSRAPQLPALVGMETETGKTRIYHRHNGRPLSDRYMDSGAGMEYVSSGVGKGMRGGRIRSGREKREREREQGELYGS